MLVKLFNLFVGLSIILLFLVIFHKPLLTFLKSLWHDLRLFFHNHKTLFDMFFLILYSVEQLILIIMIPLRPKWTPELIGIFVVIFLFTIGIERISMQSRYQSLKDNVATISNEFTGKLAETEAMIHLLRSKLDVGQGKIYKHEK